MAEEYEYQKARKYFGRYPMFEDTDSKIVGSILPTNKTDDYVMRDPNSIILDNIPFMSEHRVSKLFQNSQKLWDLFIPTIKINYRRKNRLFYWLIKSLMTFKKLKFENTY